MLSFVWQHLILVEELVQCVLIVALYDAICDEVVSLSEPVCVNVARVMPKRGMQELGHAAV